MEARAASGSTGAEEGLADMQTALDHARRAVDAADRAEGAAQQTAEHARSIAIAISVVGTLAAVALIAAAARRHR